VQAARSSCRRVNLVRTLAIEGYEFIDVYIFALNWIDDVFAKQAFSETRVNV